MYRDHCGSSSKANIKNVLENFKHCTPMVCPGGFAEAVYGASGDEKYEYAYLKNNKAYMKVAIEQKLDIIICYSYNITSMYSSFKYGR